MHNPFFKGGRRQSYPWQYGCFCIKSMIVRPKIRWKSVATRLIISLSADLLITFLFINIACSLKIENHIKNFVKIVKYIYFIPVDNYYVQVFLLLMLCSIIIHLKSIMIFIVRLYQLWAPEMMRNSCLFTPSCSEYMILAIEKYGCIKGFIKGVKRIRRCHTPNGGIDYP